jgi:hypothetical protein
MIIKKNIIVTALAIFVLVSAHTNYDVTDNISNAIESGNAAELSQYFNSNVRLKIDKTDYIYSRNQAKVIMSDFFGRNRPVNYVVTSERMSGGTTIIIGSMETEERSFRVYYQLSVSSIQQKINFLDIQLME